MDLTSSLTKHAATRCRQRGVPHEAVDAALSWGIRRSAPGGAEYWFLGHRALDRARRLGHAPGDWAGTVVVLVDDAVVTVFRAGRPPRDWIRRRGTRRRARRGRRRDRSRR